MNYIVTEDETVSDERLIRLEEKLHGITEDVADMKESNRSIAESLRKLAVLEDRHRTSDETMKRMFGAIEKNSQRISGIELQMPNLSLASSWVFRAVLVVMSLTGITYVVTILKGIGK